MKGKREDREMCACMYMRKSFVNLKEGMHSQMNIKAEERH